MKRRWPRAEVTSRVLTDCLPRLGLSGCVLSVGDEAGLVAAALESLGIRVVPWLRRAVGEKIALPWPPDGPFDAAILRLPRSREALEMKLHALGARVKCGGRLLVHGANDEGIKSAARRVEALFGNVETVEARRHCRVLQSILPDPPPVFRGRRTDWRTEVAAGLPDDTEIRWISYPGVFAHGRLDEGTYLLLGTLPEAAPGRRVLDFGCGAGLVGAEILRRQPQASVDLLDNDALALEAARENVPNGRMVLSDGWQALEKERYHLIVSNPPIHRGKDKDFGLLEEFIDGAHRHLRPGGEAWFVVQRTAPTVKLLAAGGGEYAIASETTRFRVWQVRKGGRREGRQDTRQW